MIQKDSPWVVRHRPRDKAALRLFCFPHAGAGGVIFREWFDSFPDHIEVCAIEPPGRLARRRERALHDLAEFTTSLNAALGAYLDVPFAFFGYSLGALMAFESARALRRDRKLAPTHLIVAAHKAPQMPRKQGAISREPKQAFVRELERRYGAFEPMIKADPELLDAVVEIMRVDLGMLESYRYEADAALDCPILAIGGLADPAVDQADLNAWGAQTTCAFRTEWFPGGHFFLREHGVKLRALVKHELVQA